MNRNVVSLTLAAALVLTSNLAVARQPATTHGVASGSTTETTQPQTPTGANQFASENQAQSHCAGDTVVWVNTKTHVYHFAGNSAFGHTKHGAFMCRADADRSGAFRAAKNETAGGAGTTGSSTGPARR